MIIIELVGGPHCGMTYQVVKLPPLWKQIHTLADGTSWEAYYVPAGQRMRNSKNQRCDYTEQRRVVRPPQPPPIMPGPNGDDRGWQDPPSQRVIGER